MKYFKFYSDKKYNVEAVTKFKFFACLASKLNDPDEGKVGIPFLEYEAKANESMQQARTRRSVVSFFRAESRKEMVTSSYMWANYANYDKGFCVEYNEKIFEGLTQLKGSKCPHLTEDVYLDVEYGPELIVSSEIGQLNYMDDTLGHKRKKWEVEQETRLVFRYPPIKGKGEKLENGALIPISGQKDAFSALYIGAFTPDDIRIALVDFCHKYDIPCFQMQISKKRIYNN